MKPPGEPRRIGPGRLVLVVGPSGAGKDTVIQRAREVIAGDPAYEFPKRVVTRLPSEAEDNVAVDEVTFRAMTAAREFSITWTAHGLSYGIPVTVDASLARGRCVICNVSRTVVDEVRVRYENVLVVEITAPRDILAGRLAARGRAEDGDPVRRLTRSEGFAGFRPDLTIDNGAMLEGAARAFLEGLGTQRGAEPAKLVSRPRG